MGGMGQPMGMQQGVMGGNQGMMGMPQQTTMNNSTQFQHRTNQAFGDFGNFGN